MDIAVAFAIFLSGVVICMITGQALTWALLVGFVAFFSVGLHRGHSAKSLTLMAASGAKTTLVVLRILILIGFLTALWRASGTIAFFVYWGIELSTPHTFIMIAFLLPALLCLAFGSSFGVSGTAGVILMAIARSGGANEIITAGAALSGAYFGERLSPASSAAALTCAVTGADQRDFQRAMWRTTPLPLAITLIAYAILSYLFPIQEVDSSILTALSDTFNLSLPMVIPAIILLVLPWFKFKAITSIAISCLVAAILAVVYQGMSVVDVLYVCIMGHEVLEPLLSNILSGGGLISMVTVISIVFLSTSYSGIFNGTGLLDPLKDKLSTLSDHIGLFPAQCITSLCTAGLFCNQAVGIVMSGQVTQRMYEERGHSPLTLASDVGNSVINLAGLIPWCIACSVPMASMGVGAACLPFAVYLYAVPLCRLLTKKTGVPEGQ